MLKAGFARGNVSTHSGAVHDPIYLKALVLDDGTTRAALISIDTICLGGGIGEIPDSFFPDFRNRCRKMGVGHMICGTTHSHTPYEMICEPDEFMETAVETVGKAIDALQPAKIGVGEAHDPSFAVNRTLLLKDGSAWSIRQAHPCPPDREIKALDDWDDTVSVLRVDCADGSPLCTLFTFGCHPLLGYASNAATANYPGVAERLIREETGADAMFLESCAGDVTEIDYKNYDKPKNCEVPGISLGLAALRAWRSIETRDAKLKTAYRAVTFPRRTDIPAYRERLLHERDTLVQSLADCPLNFKAFLPLYMKYLTSPDYPLGYKYEYLHEEQRGVTQLRDQDKINRANIDKYLADLEAMERLSKIASTLDTLAWHEDYNRASGSDTIDGELCGLGFEGLDCALISLPVEPLSAVGKHIRERSGFAHTLIAGYANGYMHYGAPAESYANGGYETIECFLGAGWEHIMLDAAQEIFEELR